MSKPKHEPVTLPLTTEGFTPSNTPEPAIPAAAQESPKKDRQGSIVKDPELVAMNEIAKAMGRLSDLEKERVLSWLVAKYRLTFVLQSPPSSPTE